MCRRRFLVFLAFWIIGIPVARAAEIPRISKSASGGQLIVNEKPYLILGGELGNLGGNSG
jgi:hypothetical protein